MNAIVLIILSLFAISCGSQRVKVLNSPAVSMTQDSIKSNQKLDDVKQVSGTFCPDLGQSGSFGLMDEAIKQAQEKNKVDYILNASFFTDGMCTSVEGMGAKVSSSKTLNNM